MFPSQVIWFGEDADLMEAVDVELLEAFGLHVHLG